MTGSRKIGRWTGRGKKRDRVSNKKESEHGKMRQEKKLSEKDREKDRKDR